MSDVYDAFRKQYLFSKDDLLQSVDLMIEHYDEDEEDIYSEVYRREMSALFLEFRKKLEGCFLPVLQTPYLFYQHEIVSDGIQLNLNKASDLEMGEEGDVSTMTVSEECKLLHSSCSFYTIKQYASLHTVSESTVKQWVMRGKLRNAVLHEENWLIPAVQDRPSREYESAQYILSEQISSDLFPMLSFCDSVWISEVSPNEYACSFTNFDKHVTEEIIVDKKTVEKLELLLISSGKAENHSGAQYTPILDRGD